MKSGIKKNIENVSLDADDDLAYISCLRFNCYVSDLGTKSLTIKGLELM